VAPNLLIARCLRRNRLRGDGNSLAGPQLLQAPGKILVRIGPLRSRRASQGSIEVSQCEETRGLDQPLPKRSQIQPEAFADAALGLFDLTVYLVGKQVDKASRNIGQQRLEPQALFELFQDSCCGLRHRLTLYCRPGRIIARPGSTTGTTSPSSRAKAGFRPGSIPPDKKRERKILAARRR
jgi:hypothetical protein